MTKPVPTPPRFIKLPEVRKRTALSITEIYRRIDAGEFPKQVALGPKSVAWIESEITEWCEAVIAGREVA